MERNFNLEVGPWDLARLKAPVQIRDDREFSRRGMRFPLAKEDTRDPAGTGWE